MKFTYMKNGETLSLNRDKCTGCGMCLEVCPHAVYRMESGKAEIAGRQYCMECGACKMNCPAGAIAVESGVGCAGAIIMGLIKNTSPDCGCA
jgi:NAD-dependent dihydropyrimidine dehydrogenase PreA subunit